MEILILIGAYLFFKFLVANANNTSSNDSNFSYSSNESELKLSVEVLDEVIDGKSLKFFKFKVKGMLKNKSKKVRIILAAIDVTEEEQNIMNIISYLQYSNSDIFCFTTDTIDMKYENAFYPNEIVLTELPVESFIFPKKGKRKIEFLLEIEDLIFGVVNNTKYILEYQNNEMGYVDFHDELIIAENAIVKMAIIIAGSDNTFKQVEVDAIKVFVKDLSDEYGQTSSTRFKELNDIIRNTIINSKHLNYSNEITKLSGVIKEKANNLMKHKATEFFLKLVSIDGNYSKEEQELIELICKNIDYDADRIRALKDKIISVSIHDDLSDFSSILGITSSMNDEEKKKHLREEYKKWNQRVTHSDLDIRAQATQMLELISQERSKL